MHKQFSMHYYNADRDLTKHWGEHKNKPAFRKTIYNFSLKIIHLSLFFVTMSDTFPLLFNLGVCAHVRFQVCIDTIVGDWYLLKLLAILFFDTGSLIGPGLHPFSFLWDIQKALGIRLSFSPQSCEYRSLLPDQGLSVNSEDQI